jgi:hypothetical protein
MSSAQFPKAGLLALFLSLSMLVGWELYLRHRFYSGNNGGSTSYDDNDALWAYTRDKVYAPADQATVFIGSSRMRFDVDIPTWEHLTGEKVVQLALDGESPRPVLSDLADDPRFKGKLLVDVTEGIFYYYDEPKTNKQTKYYHDRTPTQRFSFSVNRVLESQLVFLDQENFALNTLLNRLNIPLRNGVVNDVAWPLMGTKINFDRQEYFTPQFLADTTMSNKTKSIWSFYYRQYPDTPVSGKKLDSLLLSVKTDVDKIKARGGQVIFTRTPSSATYRKWENDGYPRKYYWDRLLTVTGCAGIYFEDYPAIAHFVCPEWSHLALEDAKIYTRNLVEILQQEKGWTFKSKTSTLDKSISSP